MGASISTIFRKVGILASVAAVFLLIAVSPAYAGGLAAIVCKIVDLTQNDIGKPVATAAVLGIAAMAMFGRISWGVVMVTATGVVIIFAAGSIVSTVTGAGDACGTDSGGGSNGGGTNGGGGNGGGTGCTPSCTAGFTCIGTTCAQVCATDQVCQQPNTVCEPTATSTKICQQKNCTTAADCGVGPGDWPRKCTADKCQPVECRSGHPEDCEAGESCQDGICVATP